MLHVKNRLQEAELSFGISLFLSYCFLSCNLVRNLYYVLAIYEHLKKFLVTQKIPGMGQTISICQATK